MSQTIGSILYPGQAQKEQQYQVELAAAKEAADQERTEQSQAAKNTELGARTEAETARGKYYEDLNKQRADAVKEKIAEQTSARNKTFLNQQLKGRMDDSVYQAQTDKRPQGYEFIPDPEKPGYGFAVPPSWRPAPKELLDFLPGVKEGEMIPHSTFTRANDALNKQTLETSKAGNKGDKLPTGEYQGLLKQFTDADGNVDYAGANKAWEAAQQKRAQAGKSSTTISLSSDSVDQNAKRYLETGELPSLGMGAAGADARQKILNRAAEMGRGGGSVSANKADYRAQSESLRALQKNRDAVVSFENTAGKNLDLFLKQAQPIIDSGSPWVNQPLRAISKSGLGSADLAAYNTARQVALNEIAKVTSNPGLSGQLSDSARHEVSTLLPESATLVQIYRVAGILKQEMANRRDSYDQQLGEIKGRLDGQHNTGAQNPNPNGYVIGHVYGGLTYLGGNPNDQASWKK